MRSTILTAAAVCLSLAACNWKAGQANSAQGNISQDSRPPATGRASEVTPANVPANAMAPQPTANEANALTNE